MSEVIDLREGAAVAGAAGEEAGDARAPEELTRAAGGDAFDEAGQTGDEAGPVGDEAGHADDPEHAAGAAGTDGLPDEGARAGLREGAAATDEASQEARVQPADGIAIDEDSHEGTAVEPAEGAAATEVEPEADWRAGGFSLGAPSLAAALEALLLMADEPLPAATLAQITGVPQLEVEAALAELAMAYLAEGRGIELRRVDTGWRYYTAESCRELVTRFVTDGRQARLSQAALETLAIVAYRQPVTRAQVGAVRGVNSDGVLKTLVARGLIAQSADADEAAAHFVTTPYFLDRMGVASLSELPPIADHLPDLASLDELVD